MKSNITLPSRYEDLDPEFRSKLRPVAALNQIVQQAYARMKVSGGIRFLPIFGKSGSGKTCAAMELGTHITNSHLEVLNQDHLELDRDALTDYLSRRIDLFNRQDLFIWVIDQYEERVESKVNVPSEFIEKLSFLDRGELRKQPMLFIWLTTDVEFRRSLADATSRNERILVAADFSLSGPPAAEWPEIIEETFSFHNEGAELADSGMIRPTLEDLIRGKDTIGQAIEEVGYRVAAPLYRLEDLSEYQVIMLWPVADGTGIERVTSFAHPSSGYKLNWSTWYNRLSESDRSRLPLEEYNRARLYFDFRIVPIPIADLREICADINDESYNPPKSRIDQFKKTHYFSVVEAVTPRSFGTLSERDSKRATEARTWYNGVPQMPTKIGKRLAKTFSSIGMLSKHEHEVQSEHARIVADVMTTRSAGHQHKVLTELKIFSPDTISWK